VLFSYHEKSKQQTFLSFLKIFSKIAAFLRTWIRIRIQSSNQFITGVVDTSVNDTGYHVFGSNISENVHKIKKWF